MIYLVGCIQGNPQAVNLTLRGAGFSLAKWNSNSSEFLKESFAEPPAEKLPLDDGATNILGMKWFPRSDKFTFKMNLPLNQQIVTNRIILSEVSQLYDLIGIVSPIIIT